MRNTDYPKTTIMVRIATREKIERKKTFHGETIDEVLVRALLEVEKL